MLKTDAQTKKNNTRNNLASQHIDNCLNFFLFLHKTLIRFFFFSFQSEQHKIMRLFAQNMHEKKNHKEKQKREHSMFIVPDVSI